MGSATPNWTALFNWSMKFQDGTTPTDRVELTPERSAWLQAAMAEYMVDFNARMATIKEDLDGDAARQELPLDSKEAMLDELMDIVEQIDFARDLSRIGGLATLLDLLLSPHPSLRWRAAEILGTCAQNNTPVQKDFLEGGVLRALCPLMDDPDGTVQVKALMGIGSLIRSHGPATLAFVQAGGMVKLVQLLCRQSIKVQRKAMQLIGHLLGEEPQLARSACDEGLLDRLVEGAAAEDEPLHLASLVAAARVAANAEGLRRCREHGALVGQLQAAQASLSALQGEDREAAEDRIAACNRAVEAVNSPTAPPDVCLAIGAPL